MPCGLETAISSTTDWSTPASPRLPRRAVPAPPRAAAPPRRVAPGAHAPRLRDPRSDPRSRHRGTAALRAATRSRRPARPSRRRPRLSGPVALELLPAPLHLVARVSDRLDDVHVLIRDPAHRVHPVEQVVEVRRTEDHLEHVPLPARVESHDPVCQVLLRRLQGALCDLEMTLVRGDRRLELLELDVRTVVGVDRELELGIDRLDVGEHGLRFGLGGSDVFRRRGSRSACGQRDERCRRYDGAVASSAVSRGPVPTDHARASQLPAQRRAN